MQLKAIGEVFQSFCVCLWSLFARATGSAEELEGDIDEGLLGKEEEVIDAKCKEEEPEMLSELRFAKEEFRRIADSKRLSWRSESCFNKDCSH